MRQTPMKKSHFWLGIIISVISLVVIFFFIDLSEIITALKMARYGYLVLCLLGLLIFLFLRAVRWRYLLNNGVNFATVFHIQNIGYMFTNLLPLRMGDIARAVLIGSFPPITIAQGVTTMMVERTLDILFFVILLPFTMGAADRLPDWMRSAANVSGVLAFGLIFILILAANNRSLALNYLSKLFDRIAGVDTAKWMKQADELFTGLSKLTHPKDAVLLLLYSGLIWIPIIFAYYTGLLAVNIQPTWAMAGFVVCAAAFSVAAPSSPSQVGVFHAGVIAALKVVGQPEAESASFAFLYHALNLIFWVMMGLIGLASSGATFQQVMVMTKKFINKPQNKM